MARNIVFALKNDFTGGSTCGIITPMDIQKRLESKLDKTESCWLWTAKSKDKKGYARINVNGKTTLAHRVSYELFVGPIPDGLFVCHTCDNPACCNPEHLFVGTNADNMNDCSTKGRVRNQNMTKTHCKRGHEYVNGSYYQYSGSTRRHCKECALITQRIRRGGE